MTWTQSPFLGSMNKVVIYTTPICGYCVQAKRLLTRKGVSYEEIDISRNPEQRRTMVQNSGGRMTVPQIFVNGDHIGDCDELYALDRAGKLDSLLNPA
jgi:glutaredoxin 3